MNFLWLSCSTTSLDPRYASIFDLAVCPQVEGKFEEVMHFKVKPAPLASRVRLEKESLDPRKMHKTFLSSKGASLFYYSDMALRYVDKTAEQLAEHPDYISTAIAQILDVLGTSPWYIAGYYPKFGIDVLLNTLGIFNEVAHDMVVDRLRVMPHTMLNVADSVRLLHAFCPQAALYEMTLPAVAKKLNVPVDQTDARSKLEAVMEIGKILARGSAYDEFSKGGSANQVSP